MTKKECLIYIDDESIWEIAKMLPIAVLHNCVFDFYNNVRPQKEIINKINEAVRKWL